MCSWIQIRITFFRIDRDDTLEYDVKALFGFSVVPQYKKIALIINGRNRFLQNSPVSFVPFDVVMVHPYHKNNGSMAYMGHFLYRAYKA